MHDMTQKTSPTDPKQPEPEPNDKKEEKIQQTDKHQQLKEEEEDDVGKNESITTHLDQSPDEMVTIPISSTLSDPPQKSSDEKDMETSCLKRMSPKTTAAIMLVGSAFVLVVGAAVIILVFLLLGSQSDGGAVDSGSA